MNREELKKEYAEFLLPFNTGKRKNALEKDRLGLIEVLKRDISILEEQGELINQNTKLMAQINSLNTKPICYLPSAPEYPKYLSYKTFDFKKYIFSPYKDIFIYKFSLIAFPFRCAKALVFSLLRVCLSVFKYSFLKLKNLPIWIANRSKKSEYKKNLDKWEKEQKELLSAHELKWKDGEDDRLIKTLDLNGQSYGIIVKIQFLEYIRQKIKDEILEIPEKYNYLDLERKILSCLENKEANDFYNAINSVKTEIKFEEIIENQRNTLTKFLYNLDKTRTDILNQVEYVKNTVIEEGNKTRKSVDTLSNDIDSLSSKISSMESSVSSMESSIKSMPSSEDMKHMINESFDSANREIVDEVRRLG